MRLLDGVREPSSEKSAKVDNIFVLYIGLSDLCFSLAQQPNQPLQWASTKEKIQHKTAPFFHLTTLKIQTSARPLNVCCWPPPKNFLGLRQRFLRSSISFLLPVTFQMSRVCMGRKVSAPADGNNNVKKSLGSYA
jgi:hypothetical protein